MRLENDTQIISDVKESNELCKLLNRKIKFKQCIVQIFVGSSPTKFDNFSDSDDSYDEIQKQEFKEELQIRVQNYEKKQVLNWTVAQFQDKLIMMRDAYAQQESQKGISLDESDNSLENLFDEDDFLDDLNLGNKKNEGNNMFAGSVIEESTNQNSKLQESTNTSSQIIEQDSTRAAF